MIECYSRDEWTKTGDQELVLEITLTETSGVIWIRLALSRKAQVDHRLNLNLVVGTNANTGCTIRIEWLIPTHGYVLVKLIRCRKISTTSNCSSTGYCEQSRVVWGHLKSGLLSYCGTKSLSKCCIEHSFKPTTGIQKVEMSIRSKLTNWWWLNVMNH